MKVAGYQLWMLVRYIKAVAIGFRHRVSKKIRVVVLQQMVMCLRRFCGSK